MSQFTLPWATLRKLLPLVGFASSILIPSTAVVQKYFGILGVVSYIAIVLSTLLILQRYFFTKFAARVTDRQVLWLTAATFIFLLTTFFAVYPLANSGIFGMGSDRDEALNIATTEMLNGRYPYYPLTYLGKPISPLPGSLVLAIPFVMLGNSAYQNFFWLFAFLFNMSSYLKNRQLAFLLLWVIIALSPVVLNEVVTGGDLLANSIYVLLLVMWMVSAIPQPGYSNWGKFLLAALLGVGLASRANFILILPLVFSSMVNSAGWKPAAKYTAITCLVLGLMIVPFYLYDPQRFSPLGTANELGQFQTTLPFAEIIVPLVTGIIATLLSLKNSNSNLHFLLRNCAIVLAFPVLSGTALQSIMGANPDLTFTSFGLSFLFFGAAAFWPMMFRNNASNDT
jgi:hypothetical protein